MRHIERLRRYVKQTRGLVLSRDLAHLGVPRVYLAMLIRSGELERTGRGVYSSPESFDDELYRVGTRYPKMVYSHETALYLHDLTDRAPVQHQVTVCAHYNAAHLKQAGLKVFFVKKEVMELGRCQVPTPYGHDVSCYDAERTLCDLLRSRRQMEAGTVAEAFRRYMKRRERYPGRLTEYAAALGIENILRNYVEVLT